MMSAPAHCNRRPAFAVALALAGLALASPPAGAQDPAFYALNDNGLLSLNATRMDDLPDSDWVSLVVNGSDRYALRDDGLVFKNGLKLYKLGCEDDNGDDLVEGNWVGIIFDGTSLWALSKLGYLAQDGVCVTQLDPGDFDFSTLFFGTSGMYSMRTDGTVYRDTTITPIFVWVAGPGEISGAGEGEAPDTEWLSGIVGTNGLPYALRRDGKVIRGDTNTVGDGDPSNGTVIADLPAPNGLSPTQLYTSLIFTGDEMWNVLRGSGHVFKEPNTLTALIELNDNGDTFVDLLPLPANKGAGTTDASFIALREDGNIFRETGVASVGKLPKSDYGELALSAAPPNLDNITNALPVVTKYTVLALTGTPVSFPILATDTDLASGDLVVTVDDETLPDGATFDDVARTISWPAPVLGSYKIKVQVDDGSGKLVKVAFQIKVKDPDDNPDKNFAPRAGKIKNVQGLVGIELALPIFATDQDGDPITITVDDTAEPFTLGATFDPVTNVFTWPDPALTNIGTYKVPFQVSDGTKTVKLTVQIKIKSSLLGF
jgi:Putative Ig domain